MLLPQYLCDILSYEMVMAQWHFKYARDATFCFKSKFEGTEHECSNHNVSELHPMNILSQQILLEKAECDIWVK